ncbi:DUF418 domain-containing protein [Brevundimonas vesicularis]|uniref:DUF418 domain-containing protein n=1 Tax=Brevundimonas vesicularis TaxID=41276 RepID=UPI0038D3A9B0
MTDMTSRPGAAPAVRIQTLDVVRGAAVLGILAVNIVAFALPLAAEISPEQVSFATAPGAHLAQWVVDVFFQQKFVTLFSMLFGVSIFLVGGPRRDAGRGRLLRRRLFWLAVIGVLHGAVFWYGDILLLYAWSGLFMMLMRDWSARTLILAGGGVTLALATSQAASLIMLASNPELFGSMEAGTTEGAVAQAIAAYKSGWSGMMIENLKTWGLAQAASLVAYVFPTIALMLLGLGLFKAGFFHGRLPMRIYLSLMALGAVVLVVLGILKWIALGSGPTEDATGGWAMAVLSYPIIISLAYASALVLLTIHGGGWVRRLLAPVGQMAFTNYLSQTLIMTSLFYMPWGPRLMGQVDYPAQWLFVIAVWALQLVWSPLWLRHFRMGPLEWVWRCLTHGQRLPLRRTA